MINLYKKRSKKTYKNINNESIIVKKTCTLVYKIGRRRF